MPGTQIVPAQSQKTSFSTILRHKEHWCWLRVYFEGPLLAKEGFQEQSPSGLNAMPLLSPLRHADWPVDRSRTGVRVCAPKVIQRCLKAGTGSNVSLIRLRMH